LSSLEASGTVAVGADMSTPAGVFTAGENDGGSKG
jgi:hypothetical protein